MSDPNPTNHVKDLLIAASKLAGVFLFRRNVGMGWIGNARMFHADETITAHKGDVLIRSARPFHSGIEGQSDVYGWQEVIITADMVGTKIAQHVEIEGKTGSGREATAQKSWGAAVTRSGGVYGVAREVSDVARILGR